MNKCDECGTELVKTFVMTKFEGVITVWVCPKSELFQLYEEEFKREYHKKIK